MVSEFDENDIWNLGFLIAEPLLKKISFLIHEPSSKVFESIKEFIGASKLMNSSFLIILYSESLMSSKYIDTSNKVSW